MHPALLQMLARQRVAQLPQAAVNGRQRPVPASKPARVIRQRIGWALVHAGLRLIVARELA